MPAHQRQLFIVIGGIFGAAFVHSLLPPGDIWMRAAFSAAAAIVMVCLLALLLPHAPKE